MGTLRAVIVTCALSVGLIWNLSFARQIMTFKPPVFNGPDVAENYEWRRMADGSHDWWLWANFPEAEVRNAGFVERDGSSSQRPEGIQFASVATEYLGLNVDPRFPPLEVSHLGVREELLEYSAYRSRIDCLSEFSTVKLDSCDFFVSFDSAQISKSPKVFYAVRTSKGERPEYGLVEEGLLSSVLSVPISELENQHQADR